MVSDLEMIPCHHEDRVLQGQLAVPGGPGPHPAVLVAHSAFGLGSHIREAASRLAAEGYLALAVDMYGGGAYSEDQNVVAELVKPVWGNAPRLRSRMGTWLELLKTRPDVDPERIAAIGYCFGGQCVLELARGGADVKAVVCFHGILTTNMPAEPGAVRAYVSVHTGARDPHAPRDDVEALRTELISAGADWQLTEYGSAYHAFTDPKAAKPEIGRAYNFLADRISWASMLSLLNARLDAAIPS